MVAVADVADELLKQALEEIRSRDPLELRRIHRDLGSGGRLRLVVDAEGPLLRLRWRLLSALGTNRWVWSGTVTAK